MKSPPLDRLLWPETQLNAALRALVGPLSASPVTNCPPAAGSDNLTGFVLWYAKANGCEARPLVVPARGLPTELVRNAPALLRLPGRGLLVLTRAEERTCRLLTPDGESVTVRSTVVGQYLLQESGDAHAEYERLLRYVPNFRRSLDKLNPGRLVDAGWFLQPAPAPGLRTLLRSSWTGVNAAVLLATHLAQYGIWIVSWYILGRLSLTGRLDHGWLVAWSLLLLTLIPLRVFETHAKGLLALSLSSSLKQHLLLGTLRLTPDEVRTRGLGGVLNQVFESSTVDTIALNGGISGLLAILELLVSTAALGPLSVLLVLCFGLAAFLSWRFFQSYRSWTDSRLTITADLLENMVGHRTRLAQQLPHRLHDEEDLSHTAYLAESRRVDRVGAAVVAAMPRCWLIASLLALAPGFLAGQQSVDQLAIRLGGVLMAFSALGKLTGAAIEICATGVALSRIRPLFRAASRPETVGTVPPLTAPASTEPALAEIDRVSFQHEGAPRVTLQGASLSVRPGDRVLLEGPSGGGKTTVVQLLAGLRKPAAGLVLTSGLDRFTRGESGWRKQVAAAPQFHDNYLLSDTLAANLLLGRPWPLTRADVEAAEAVCRELQLGYLLDRMPGGIMQIVGEGGWQLSHGERSRVFLARALLQNAPLTILDETLGALDPETLEQAFECTLSRTNALVVVAHP